jgi:tetratricopeptide (TPR) repeat protein
VKPIGLVLTALLLAPALAAQQSDSLRRAQAAYDALDYQGAISAAKAALAGRLAREDQISAYELLGFAYGALDSTAQAVDAFQRLIFLDPDREPDVERVSPRITRLYSFALGQVLVVRRLRLDSASFIAGQAGAPVRFEVSRAARTRTRVIGPGGLDFVVDSQTVAGGSPTRFDWPATGPDGRPLPPGEYQLITTAYEGDQNEFSSLPHAVRLSHAARDTLAALTHLAGYEEQPELVSPPRDWRPLLLAVLYTGIGAGAFLAIEQGNLGTGPRTGLISVSAAALGTGLAISLRRAEPRPSQPNILYNRLLRELLARQNAEIARENLVRRSQVVITVAPVR